MKQKMIALILVLLALFIPLASVCASSTLLPQEPAELESLILTQFKENTPYAKEAALSLGFVYILQGNQTLPEGVSTFYGSYEKVVISEVFFHNFFPPFRQLQIYAFGVTKEGAYEKTATPDDIRARLYDLNLFADLDFEIISFE